MQFGPWTIARTKALPLQPLSGSGGWWPVIGEPYMGAWQRNTPLTADTALSFSAVFGCVTLIMGDVGKLNMRLVEFLPAPDGIWVEVDVPAFSPVLRQPNRSQHWSLFAESWQASLQTTGNTYVLKEMDGRDVVRAMYVLDPHRVTPMVAPDGSVFYELKRDDLSGLATDTVLVPADRIIHDRINCLFHPLIGLSPIYACAVAAGQGKAIEESARKLAAAGNRPRGILTTPLNMDNATAARLKAIWDADSPDPGFLTILSNDLKFQPLAFNPQDMQIIEQLSMTAKTVCTAYHVPPQLLDIGSDPAYANITPYIQKYYSQCLQRLLNLMERALDNGLGLGKRFGNPYGTEFDPDDLIWMDNEAKSKAAQEGIGSGGMSPNEARKKYYALGPVAGGETPYLQEQNWPIQMLADRELPAAAPTAPAPISAPATDDGDESVKLLSLVRRKQRAA